MGNYKPGNGTEYMMFQNQVHTKKRVANAKPALGDLDNYLFYRMKENFNHSSRRAAQQKMKQLETHNDKMYGKLL